MSTTASDGAVGAQDAIGVMGGTFDPIHFGHLRLAEEMADVLGLAQVVFVPAGRPPHRGAPQVDARDRLELVRRAVTGNARFVVDDREIEYSAPSYTVDTLTSLRAEWGAKRRIWLLLGADAFHGLPQWHAWQRLFDLANIAVAARPGAPTHAADAFPPALHEAVRGREVERGDDADAAGSVYFRKMTALEISATALRAARARGDSVRYLVPDAVLNYMDEHSLYRNT